MVVDEIIHHSLMKFWYSTSYEGYNWRLIFSKLPVFFLVFGNPIIIVPQFVGACVTLCVLNLSMVNHPWHPQHRPSPKLSSLNGVLLPYLL